MTSESTYHAVTILILAVCLPIGITFRIRSIAGGEKLARREEGLFILIGLRLCGILVWAVVLAYLINPSWVAWATVLLPDWLRWAGACLGLFLVPPLWFWTFQSLGKNLTDTVVTRREHTLITHGPYRWVRHPFYGVVFLFGLSLSLITANGLLAALGLVVMAILVTRTPIEEAKLIERFGRSYLEYAERTGRFFPRPR